MKYELVKFKDEDNEMVGYAYSDDEVNKECKICLYQINKETNKYQAVGLNEWYYYNQLEIVKDMNVLLKVVEAIAKESYGGHYTLMKFTTDWRFCFGTPFENEEETMYMAEGKTMYQAIMNGIVNNTYALDFEIKNELYGIKIK